MANFEESYIVRVRADGDAFVEQVRSRRRLHVDDLADIGAVVARRRAGARPALAQNYTPQPAQLRSGDTYRGTSLMRTPTALRDRRWHQ